MNAYPIIVLTNERDLAADDVIRRISAHGNTVARINIEEASTKPTFSWQPDQLSGSSPGAVWWRQFELARESTMSLVGQ